MGGPHDPSLPFFAYGLFRQGQLGWLRLSEFVADSRTLRVPGDLRARDGLVVLVEPSTSSRFVEGSLITFHEENAADAYESINAIEPDKLYRWETLAATVGDDAELANVLVGRGTKGYAELLGPWDGRHDPVFTSAFQTAQELVNSGRPHNDTKAPDWDGFFRVQAGYMLLWSAIERYGSLRHSLGKNRALENNAAIAAEPAFGRALQIQVEARTAEVRRSDDPSEVAKLDSNEPEKSIKYFYQLRSNVTHRGKGSPEYDLPRLLNAFDDLMVIFRSVLEDAFAEASR